MVGRPSKYSDALSRKICDRIASGESLRRVCADKGMPSRSTVTEWLGKYDDFRASYAHAQDVAFDDSVDAMEAEIAATPADSAEVAKMRLLMDMRKWKLSKLRPKKYGDKVQTEVSGKDGGPIVLSWEE